MNLLLNKTVNSQNGKIQILRGMAILAVVIIHSYPQGIFGVFLRPFVNFAVAMFIFLSGYLTKIDMTDYKTTAIKRIKKVLVPYVIWSVIYMIPYKFDGFLIKLLTGQCCGTYYYIFVYIQFVLLTPLIVKLIMSKWRVIGWFITPFFVVLFRYVFVWSGYDFLSSNFNYAFVAWFIFYYMGLILGNNLSVISRKRGLYVVIYVITIILSICEGIGWYRIGNYDMATTQIRLTSTATSVCFIVLAYFFIKYSNQNKNGIIGKALLLLGNTSFGIYLSHMLIKGVLMFLSLWQYLIFPLNTIVLLTISVLCVLVGKKILSKYSWVLGL